MAKNFTTTPEAAPKLLGWIKAGRGVAFWESADPSDPGWSCVTPALTKDQLDLTPKPSWKAAYLPAIATEASDITVVDYKEVKRIEISLERRGRKILLTVGSSRRLRKALANAGEGSTYMFDGWEAIIYAPGGSVPLSEWKEKANG